MRLRNSFWALLGREESEAPEVVVERVRRAMLAVLDKHVRDSTRSLTLQLLVARDIETLWYLRPDLMHAIAASRGETVARECMTQITTLFKGHHAGASPSRFGSL